MPLFHVHEYIHACIICSGLAMNLTTIAVVLIKTSNELKEYSVLLLNTSFVELSSIFANFLIHCRLFVDAATVVSIADGPCTMVSDQLCMVIICFVHVNMIHSNSIITLSFWYRKRVLQGRENLGKFRLQLIITLLFIPHIFHIAHSVKAASPREMLEPIVDEFYGPNSTVGFGLHGFINVLDYEPAIALTYLIFVPVFSNNYIIYTRKKLLGMMQEKMRHMSTKTRGIHESFTKVLTISAATSALFAPILMIGSAIAQVCFRLHSVDIEGFVYHGAVLPALVNPALTLYFVKAYRMLIMSFFRRRNRKISTSTQSHSLQYTV